MKIYPTISVLVLALLTFFACNSTSTGISSDTSSDHYINQIMVQASQYNSARDTVERTIKLVDSASTLSQGMEAARRGVSDLEGAVSRMNEAYRALANRDVAIKYHEHQEATLSAWRAGIEATVTIKLGLEEFLTTGQIDSALVLATNRLFAEEDRYQLKAKRALQAAR